MLQITSKVILLSSRYFAVLCSLFFIASGQSVFAQSAFDDPGARDAGQSKGGDLTALDKKIDAGAVALGSDSQVVVLFRNESAKPINAGDISLYPSSNVSASVGSNECKTAPVLPDAVCAIAMTVKGLQPGNFRIEMLMRHDGRTKLVTSSVSGLVDSANDATREVIRDLEVLPGDLDFGDLKESRPLTRSVVLRNVTSKEIEIESMAIESNDQAGYALKTDCESLLSGAACVATVSWTPQQVGPATGVLAIKHNGPTGVVTVLLDGKYEPGEAQEVGIFPEAVPGKGLLTASQTAVDFGDGINASSSITVSLVNVGDTPLEIKDIYLSNEESGVTVSKSGCVAGSVLAPIQACPLTLKWEPVREGSILDDVQIIHDGARGILVIPVRGEADEAINKDSQAFVVGDDFVGSIPALSSADLQDSQGSNKSVGDGGNVSGSLEGYKVTSLARNRAIVSGPGGSRVVFDGQETVIAGVLWRVKVLASAVKFTKNKQKVILLFDRSLSSSGSVSSVRTDNSRSSSTSSTSSNSSDEDN